jgi:hypothetical protein
VTGLLFALNLSLFLLLVGGVIINIIAIRRWCQLNRALWSVLSISHAMCDNPRAMLLLSRELSRIERAMTLGLRE